jgi:hypothetical protein
MRSNALDYLRTEGQIGRKMPINDVNVNIIASGGIDCPNFVAELGKIS